VTASTAKSGFGGLNKARPSTAYKRAGARRDKDIWCIARVYEKERTVAGGCQSWAETTLANGWREFDRNLSGIQDGPKQIRLKLF
jgi:hypothetical protein